MWAIGCLMGELTDGEPMFAGDSDIDQLMRIQKVQGGLTEEMTRLFKVNPNNQGIKLNVPKQDDLQFKYGNKLDSAGLDFLRVRPTKRMLSKRQGRF